MGRSRTTMSPMERVLALRTIPLFQDLSTADLRRLADLADERAFADGEVISSEGEIGDELHLVLDGTVQTVVLASAWAGAALGVVLSLAWISAPRWLQAVTSVGPVRRT